MWASTDCSCAVGKFRDLAARHHRRRPPASEQGRRLPAGELTECIVDVDKTAVVAAADDDVALCFEKALGALFGIAQLEAFVRQRLKLMLEARELMAQRALPVQQHERAAAKHGSECSQPNEKSTVHHGRKFIAWRL